MPAWPPSRLAGSGTGVFVGASLTDYGDLRQADLASGDRYFMTGGALSILANRIGNVFDLHGPAQTVDTACSSSLVALHWACRGAARRAACRRRWSAGSTCCSRPIPSSASPAPGCSRRPAAAAPSMPRADGYVRAEGAGVVVLKPLDGRAARRRSRCAP